jgi:hypothetical protein
MRTVSIIFILTLVLTVMSNNKNVFESLKAILERLELKGTEFIANISGVETMPGVTKEESTDVEEQEKFEDFEYEMEDLDELEEDDLEFFFGNVIN